MKRLLAGILSLLIVFACFPWITTLASEKSELNQVWDSTVGEGNTAGSMKISQTEIASTADTYKSASFALNGSTGNSVDLRAYEGISFWVKISSSNVTKMKLSVIASEQLNALSGATYYLQESGGQRAKYSVENGTDCICLPGDFCGLVAIPFSEIVNEKGIETLSAASSLLLSVNSQTLGNGTMWIDSIQAYSEAKPSVKSLFEFDEDAANVTLSAGVMSLCRDDCDNGLLQVTKGTAASGEGQLIFTLTDKNYGDYEGFRIYVKNPQTAAAQLRIKMTYSARGMANRPYLKEDSNGNISEAFFADDGRIDVPSGFSGYLYFPFSSFGIYEANDKLPDISNLTAFIIRIMDIEKLGTDCLYFDHVQAYKETPTVYSMMNSDLINSKITCSSVNLSVINQALQLKFPQNDNTAVKFDTVAMNVNLLKDTTSRDISGYSYVGWYIKTDGSSADNITMRLKMNAGISAYWRSNVPYILVDAKTGKKETGMTAKRTGASLGGYNNEAACGISIPGGFEGFVYLAIPTQSQIGTYETAGASAYDKTKTNKIFLLFDRDQAAERTLVIDSLGFYHAAENIGSIPALLLCDFAENVDVTDRIPYTFESGSMDGVSVGKGFSSATVIDTQAGKQLSLVRETPAAVQAAFHQVAFSAKATDGKPRDVRNQKGISFYIETDGSTDQTLYVRPKWTAGLTVMLKSGVTYYLMDAVTNVVTQYSTAARTVYPSGLDNYKYERAKPILIPGGFKGYVYIPFVSANQLETYDTTNTEAEIAKRLDYSQLTGFQLNFDSDSSSGRNVLLDNVGFYNTDIIPTPANKEILYDFDTDLTGVLTRGDAALLLAQSTAFHYGENGSALEISQSQVMDSTAGTERNVYFSLKYPLPNGTLSDFTGCTGIKFWVKFDAQSDATVRLRPKFNISAQSRGLANRPYYLESDDGTISSGSFYNGGFLDISGSFSGFVYVPFTSLGCWDSSLNVDVTRADSMEINIDSAKLADKKLYIDQISTYIESPVINDGIDETGAGMFYDFEKKSLSGITADNTLKAEISSDFCAEQSAYGLRITQPVYDSVNPIRQLSFLSNYTGKPRDVNTEAGLAFYVRCDGGSNAITNHLQLMIQMDAPSRCWFRSGNPYYLVDKNGLATQFYFTKDSGGAGVIKVRDNFEGYVYVPFSSMSAIDSKNAVDLSKLGKIIFHVRSSYLVDRSVYIDNLQSYTVNPAAKPAGSDQKYIMNFDDMSRPIDLEEKVTTSDPIRIELSDQYAKAGNSLKVTTTFTSAGEAAAGANIMMSMMNEDGTLRNISDFSGIRMWVKVIDKSSGSNTTPVKLRLQADMPSRVYAVPSSQYYLYDGGQYGKIGKMTRESDPTGIVSVDRGFEGYVYFPMTDMFLFDSTQVMDSTQLRRIFLYAIANSLVDAELYIDEMSFYDAKELPPILYPGDPNYNPDNDILLRKVNTIVGGIYPVALPETSARHSDKNDVKASLLVGICAVSALSVLVIKKRKKYL